MLRGLGALGVVAALTGPCAAAAQSVRGWVGSTVQVVELRPISRLAAECPLDGVCYVASPEVRSASATQDVSLTAWGMGVRGLSATVLARGRARLGSDLVWPRSDDELDVLLAYGQLVRGPLTVRLGRQEVRAGLGFPSFDGAHAAWTARRWRVEGYGGRSLARGLREPAHDALRGVEDFHPDQGVLLVGAAARLRSSDLSATLRYQRELLADRSGLESERASLDASWIGLGARLTGSVDYDFAFGRVGKGHATASVPRAGGRLLVEASVRRYVPYFSMSTIWGFFDPVAYSEAVGRVAWSPRPQLGAWLAGGLRRYGDTGAQTVLRPLEDDGRRLEAGARWAPADEWLLQARYELEWGPGGFLSAVDASARWAAGERASVLASVTTFQQIEQYRLGDGRAFGGGLSGDVELTERWALSGGAFVLRHRSGPAVDNPWSQSRAWSSVRVRVGRDPGLGGAGR